MLFYSLNLKPEKLFCEASRPIRGPRSSHSCFYCIASNGSTSAVTVSVHCLTLAVHVYQYCPELEEEKN